MGLTKTLYPTFGSSYLLRVGPQKNPVDPQKELDLHVTGLASLAKIGEFV